MTWVTCRDPRQRATIAVVALLALFAALAGCRREVAVPPLDPAIAQITPGASESAPVTGMGGANPAPAGRGTAGSIPPTPTRVPPDDTASEYTVRPGDTLLRIAVAYGTTTESLIALNGLTNPDQLVVGQTLMVSTASEYTGPESFLVPDSEVVYGPGYADFDVSAEVQGHPGLLAQYAEVVNGREMSGAEIIQLASQQYSVGPRVLLALLELRGGWLSNPAPGPAQQTYPLGYNRATYWNGLYMQLCQAANALNTGFYGWYLDDLWLIQTQDTSFIQYAPGLNAGTAAVQKVLADTAPDYESFLSDVERFASVYRELFGDPGDYAVEPLLSAREQAPELTLPWASGETWYYTGGPHVGWGTLGALSAVDFVSDERNIGCAISQRWVTAAADGLIIASAGGMVLQDLDGDGIAGTGWVVLYMHIAGDGRVAVGEEVKVGDPIGHPSCEGGVSDASHLHLARRVNGVWIAADDPNWPMSLSGWVPIAGTEQYEGTLEKAGETLTACECWEPINGVTH